MGNTVWHVSFGNSPLAVFADSWLFFLAALALLTYLGIGISFVSLPGSLRRYAWLLAPYLGCSLFVTISALVVASGSDIRSATLLTMALASVANLELLRRDARGSLAESSRYWLFLLLFALPVYSIVAISMAHAGSLAYVGGQRDLYLYVPLAEWLKEHGAPLLSFGSTWWIDPNWSASIPPLGEWYSPGAHLGYAGHRADDIMAPFQRGPAYLQSALALILGWDSYLVFRPTMAFLLALCPPPVFLFCRQQLRASVPTSILAGVLTALNGTLFFWITFGHPSQALATPLLPVAIVLSVAAIESGERPAILAAAMSIAALLVSYYWAIAPVLLFVLPPSCAYLLWNSRRRVECVTRAGLLGLAALLMTLPEQVKLMLVWTRGSFAEIPGWNDPSYALPTDALGTTLMPRVLDLVAGQGQAGQQLLGLTGGLSFAATLLAVAIAALGITRPGATRAGRFLPSFLGMVALLVCLRLAGNPYGYSKAQAILTFLPVCAIALGIDALWHTVHRWASRRYAPGLSALRVALLATGIPTLLIGGVAAMYLALGAYAFWKPVGNIWDPNMWQVSSLAGTLPEGTKVRLSPNILADPETLWMVTYLLRNQQLRGAFDLQGMIGTVSLVDRQNGGDDSGAEVEILGSSEVAAARGLLDSDLTWSDSLLSAYRRPATPELGVLARSADGVPVALPALVPATAGLRLAPALPAGEMSGSPAEITLLLTFASDSPSRLELSIGPGEISRSLEIGAGVSVRSITLAPLEQVRLLGASDTRPRLLSAKARAGAPGLDLREDYPEALVAIGESSLVEHTVTTRLTYLDIGFPVFHSLDLFDGSGHSQHGWFELPTYPDKLVREVRFDLDLGSLEPRSALDGVETVRRFSSRDTPDGEYTAHFAMWSKAIRVKALPLFRYRSAGNEVVEFEPFRLMSVWKGEASR